MTDRPIDPFAKDPDTPPVPPEPSDRDWPDVKHAQHTITVLCQECGSLIEVHDPVSYILANHLRDACKAMVLLNGNGE